MLCQTSRLINNTNLRSKEQVLPVIAAQMILDMRCSSMHIGGIAEGTWEYAQGMRVPGIRC